MLVTKEAASMLKLADVTKALPRMLTGTELADALQVIPSYNPRIRQQDTATRLTALSDLYRIYLPSPMSSEIYTKLYLAMLRSLQKKGTKLAIQQSYQNARARKGLEFEGIIGGSDSFTIIGTSGIGKSSAISRAVSVISASGIIEVDEPYTRIIPALTVQCPFDCSVKGMLLEILRRIDETINSSYYSTALRVRATSDMLIGSVSQAALNHVGLLIVDEIQNVVGNKHGKALIAALTQLINNSGISIGLVGTPECLPFFEKAMPLARRSLGLQYTRMEYDQYFCDFCSTLYRYQYIQQPAELTPNIVDWLYEHSGGILSCVASTLHAAQEIAILDGSEELSLASLNRAYLQRMSLLHGHIAPSVNKKHSSTIASPSTAPIPALVNEALDAGSITAIIAAVKEQQLNPVSALRPFITVEEVYV